MRASVLIVCLIIGLWTRIHCRSKDNTLIKDEEIAKQFLLRVNSELVEQIRNFAEANWAYATNINNETSAAAVRHAINSCASFA